ncbi:MAG: hypothetical protein IPP83_11920 [Flavobacteriales bacterium]|nr:hypothetical protein [Flavobacteriales bacterium]
MASLRSLTGVFGLSFLLASCGGSGEGEGQQADSLATVQETPSAEVFGIGGKLFSVPSPTQTALAIRKAGLKYQKELTAPLEKGDAVSGKAAQATLLGVFGADLSYVTVHKDGQRALATMQAVERLGGRLELTNAFDRALLDRFKSSMGNEDSLLRLTGVAFRAADQYLKNSDRDDVSALVLTGGWIESMHLSLADPAAMKDKVLMARVGEQKKTLAGLVELLAATDKEGAAVALIAGLKDLSAEFEKITIAYKFEPPVTDAAAKTTFINSTVAVEIPAEQLTSITAKVAALRNMILA